MIRLFWLALLTYFIVAVLALMLYVAIGLDLLGESVVPLGGRLLAIPILLLEAPIWFVRDTFAASVPAATRLLRVLGAFAAIAIAVVVSRRILRKSAEREAKWWVDVIS